MNGDILNFDAGVVDTQPAGTAETIEAGGEVIDIGVDRGALAEGGGVPEGVF